MSQIAIIEIDDIVIDCKKICYKEFDGNTQLEIINSYKLNFFNDSKTYINILTDPQSRQLDILIFDYKIDLNDFDKMFDVISPLFTAVEHLINSGIDYYKIKLFISEDDNVEYDDFIKIDTNYLNPRKSFVDYFSTNNVITTNCFPPIMFSFRK